jgi:hypothetical protein
MDNNVRVNIALKYSRKSDLQLDTYLKNELEQKQFSLEVTCFINSIIILFIMFLLMLITPGVKIQRRLSQTFGGSSSV